MSAADYCECKRRVTREISRLLKEDQPCGRCGKRLEPGPNTCNKQLGGFPPVANRPKDKTQDKELIITDEYDSDRSSPVIEKPYDIHSTTEYQKSDNKRVDFAIDQSAIIVDLPPGAFQSKEHTSLSNRHIEDLALQGSSKNQPSKLLSINESESEEDNDNISIAQLLRNREAKERQQ